MLVADLIKQLLVVNNFVYNYQMNMLILVLQIFIFFQVKEFLILVPYLLPADLGLVISLVGHSTFCA